MSDDTKYFEWDKTHLEVEIKHHIKRAFVHYCRKRDIRASDAIQQHIEDLLARARIDPEDFR